MSRVLVLVEGETEEAFVKSLLAPHLRNHGVELTATILGKPRKKSGGIDLYKIACKDILAALRSDAARFCTTMVDYYGLPLDWPGRRAAKKLGFREGVRLIQNKLLNDIADRLGKAFDRDRFIPYVQLHEFEALLFSDPAALEAVAGETSLSSRLRGIVENCGEPEAINDNPELAPSKRIQKELVWYQKPLHGIQAAARIGIEKMRKKCPHFCDWITRLENLTAPTDPA